MKNIGKKMLAVMDEVESVEKDGFNAFHKYKYTSDAAIVTAIRKALIKNKLVIIPTQTACTQVGDITTLTVAYKILDTESGELIEGQSFGQGQDKGDKGVYKAATGAEKYFLLKTFLIPTDDDPENDKKAAPVAKTTPKVWPHPAETKDENSGSRTIVIEGYKDFVSKKGTPYIRISDAQTNQYMIFDKALVQEAKALVGQEVLISYETNTFGTTVKSLIPLFAEQNDAVAG